MKDESKNHLVKWGAIIAIVLFCPFWLSIALAICYFLFRKCQSEDKKLDVVLKEIRNGPMFPFLILSVGLILLSTIDISVAVLGLSILILHKLWSDNRNYASPLITAIPSAELIAHTCIAMILMLPLIAIAILFHEILYGLFLEETIWLRHISDGIRQSIEEGFVTNFIFGNAASTLQFVIYSITGVIIGLINIILMGMYVLLGFACIKVLLTVVFRIVIMKNDFPIFKLQSPIYDENY